MTLLSSEILSALIRSVGTHRGIRDYSPIEVAELFKASLEGGVSRSKLAQQVLLNPSMVGRFLRLLELPDEVGILIDWGGKGAHIVMSTASEIARLKDPEDQKTLAYSVLEYRMTKPETQEVVQLVLSGAADVPDAISRTIRARPKLDRRFVFVGALVDPVTLDSLSELTQFERDAIFARVMEHLLPPGMECTFRLGKNRFMVSGGEELQGVFRNMLRGFEAELSGLIAQELNI